MKHLLKAIGLTARYVLDSREYWDDERAYDAFLGRGSVDSIRRDWLKPQTWGKRGPRWFFNTNARGAF
jgi:hypothetical protein